MGVNRFVLNGISYHGHGAINEIPAIVKAKGLKKAFQLQMQGKGFTFVELLTNCPTNWHMTPLQTLDYMNTNTIPYFVPGVYKDKYAEVK